MFFARDKFKDKKDDHKDVVIDLDAIIEKPQYIKFMGVIHKIEPIEVGQFFCIAEGMAQLQKLRGAEKISNDMLVDSIYGILLPCAPTMTKEMVREATLPQISALLQFVLDHVNGRLSDDEKKKNQVRLQISNPLQ